MAPEAGASCVGGEGRPAGRHYGVVPRISKRAWLKGCKRRPGDILKWLDPFPEQSLVEAVEALAVLFILGTSNVRHPSPATPKAARRGSGSDSASTTRQHRGDALPRLALDGLLPDIGVAPEIPEMARCEVGNRSQRGRQFGRNTSNAEPNGAGLVASLNRSRPLMNRISA